MKDYEKRYKSFHCDSSFEDLNGTRVQRKMKKRITRSYKRAEKAEVKKEILSIN
jgi:transposase-like protein